MTYTARQLVQERNLRSFDGLSMFRALTPDADGMPPGVVDQSEIFRCDATELLIRGGNRAGKTVCSAALFAAIARDRPITTWAGEQIDCRRPWQKNRPLLMWVVGIQLNHIGQTIHRALFRSGLYKIIPDHVTGAWRAYREWDPADKTREHLCKPSPPLIPSSEIDPDGWAWENNAAREFTKCSLRNGTEIYAFASSGEVKAGDPVDVIWLDERIRYASHYPEWRMRLLDKRGRLVWSTKSYAGNSVMMELTEKAAIQAEEVSDGVRDRQHIVEIRLSTHSNPFIEEEAKKEATESLSAGELANRMEGDYETDSALIYPYFSKRIHWAIPDYDSHDRIADILANNNGFPPNDWCHELILDPGTQKPAVLFGAVPPPHLWESNVPVLVVYDEIYGRRMDAKEIAQAVKSKTLQGRTYNRFIIDGRAGRQTAMSWGISVERNYAEEFTNVGLKPVGHSQAFFEEGNPDFVARKMMVDQYLAIRDNGLPGLRIVIDRCPSLVWQMTNNHFLISPDGTIDDRKPASRQKDDMRDCLEYWVSKRPRYVPPPKIATTGTNIWDEHQNFVKQRFGQQVAESPYIEIGGAS